MNMILSADENWGIGKNGALLARLPGDMKYFKAMTMGKTVVMGRKTFLSLPKGALPGRKNVVLSRGAFSAPGVTVYKSVEEALGDLSDDAFVMGGGEVYRAFLPYVKTIYVTKIFKTFEADAFFLNLDAEPGWILAEQGETQEEKGVAYAFCRYERRRK